MERYIELNKLVNSNAFELFIDTLKDDINKEILETVHNSDMNDNAIDFIKETNIFLKKLTYFITTIKEKGAINE